MLTTLETLPASEKPNKDIASHGNDLSPEQAWQKVNKSESLSDALDALDSLPQDDVRWRIASESSILNRFSDTLPPNVEYEVKEQMKHDAIELAQRRLPSSELRDIGLEPESQSEEPLDTPTIRDVMLLGDVWDTTDRDELTGRLLVHLLDHLSSYNAETFNQALQIAMEDKITFKEACATIQRQVDKRIDRQSINTSERGDVKFIDENDPFVKKYNFRVPPTDVIDTAHLTYPDGRRYSDDLKP